MNGEAKSSEQQRRWGGLVPTLTGIRERIEQEERDRLCEHACPSSRADRQNEPREQRDRRLPFALDADRILHSAAYTRYIDKTQVFSLCDNDHITHRALHVQFVSRIARDIGTALGLNSDLIEAIALGHDIGHAPFGHEGERQLRRICRDVGLLPFQHNVQSVRLLRELESLNLTLQVYDGILCHDGEVHNVHLQPRTEKTWEDHLRECRQKNEDPETTLVPLTLEGCLVRMCDVISYLGRDIEDAITLELIERGDVPETPLGRTNRDIVWNLVQDLIATSYGQPFVAFSDAVGRAVKELKGFNYERIYLIPPVLQRRSKLRVMFDTVYSQAREDVERGRERSRVFVDHIALVHPRDYLEANSAAQVALDFVAGMTDDYCIRFFKELALPRRFMRADGLRDQ